MTATVTARLITCPCCRSSGSVELTGEYALTLARLEALGGREIHGAGLARLMKTRGPAMSNRLSRLEALGFLASRRHGRKRLFRIVRTQPQESQQ